MRTRVIWLSLSSLCLLILIPLSNALYRDLKVHNNGNIVKVTIVSVPGNGAPGSGFLKFKLNNKIYDKNISGDAGAYMHVGDSIELRYLKGYEDRFLLPDENPAYWGFTVIIMFIIMIIGGFYYGLKKNPPVIIILGKKLS